ncbi:integrase catalytic domain-containing protein [Lentzea flava]|uniref:integrase catalytic domain-containing protein n=1 Tax=Lentzea flava TaxID=103732 RepID=UPI001E373A31|nr:integrase [Lentzea flava]
MSLLEPLSLLETLPPDVVARARDWERHVLEVETGLTPGATAPRSGFDPVATTVEQRDQAKAAELTAGASRPAPARSSECGAATAAPGSGAWSMRVTLGGPRTAGSTNVRSRPPARRSPSKCRARPGRSRGCAASSSSPSRPSTGEGTVPLPSRRTFERLVDGLLAGLHTFGPATSRRTHANRPDGPFTPTVATRPGELVQIDTTPLDVMAVLDDGVFGRVELTIALDIATRTITAAILRPHGTKAVEAAPLLARTLVPEPMRPGWPDALSMARSRIPHARLLTLDARLQQAAAKPVIAPETVIVDRGKAFISETFLRACERLEISVQPAHPRSPTEKAMVERTFGSINTLFCQHVAGYTGSSVAHRGADQRTVWTLSQLEELFGEWVLAGWQTRLHHGLRDRMCRRNRCLNDMYYALITAAGYVPIVLVGEDYLELLPVEWRRINHDGVQLDYRTYDSPALAPLRRQNSGIAAMQRFVVLTG